MFNWKEYKSQGVQSVDMCASIIFAHRARTIPVKALHLLPNLYEQFKGWLQKEMKRDLLPDEKMQFDDIAIEKGSASQSSAIVIELWEQQPKAAPKQFAFGKQKVGRA